MKVLIIEDEDLVFQIIKTFLESMGLICERFIPCSLLSLVEYLKEYNPDVIICDYMMPNLTGLDILNALNDDFRKKFIIMTGGIIESDVMDILKYMNIKVIYKPFDIMELYSAIKERL